MDTFGHIPTSAIYRSRQTSRPLCCIECEGHVASAARHRATTLYLVSL